MNKFDEFIALHIFIYRKEVIDENIVKCYAFKTQN